MGGNLAPDCDGDCGCHGNYDGDEILIVSVE